MSSARVNKWPFMHQATISGPLCILHLQPLSANGTCDTVSNLAVGLAVIKDQSHWSNKLFMTSMFHFFYRLFNMERAAKALANGMTSFEVLNNNKLDKDLAFATHGLNTLAAKVDPEDATSFPSVWKPKGVPMSRDGKLMPSWEGLTPMQRVLCEMTPQKYGRLMMVAVYRKMFKMNITE